MPWAAPRPCNQPGCAALTHDGYCAAHKKKRSLDYNRERGSAASRGYDHRWRAYRLRFLQLHPLCAVHLKIGETVAATVVDHIKPHKGDQRLFWNVLNHQALCEACHNTKTATEDGGWGRGVKSLQP